MLSDPIADMLTRIRNATRVHKETVDIPASKFKEQLAGLLVFPCRALAYARPRRRQLLARPLLRSSSNNLISPSFFMPAPRGAA